MPTKLYQITCSPDCGFQLRSHDREEVKKLTKEHVRTAHKMEAKDADVEKQIKQLIV